MLRGAVVAALLFLALVGSYAAFIARYAVIPSSTGALYLFDRWTGRLEFCAPQACETVPRRWQDAAPAQ